MTLRIVNKRVNSELSKIERRFKRSEDNEKIVIEIEPYFKFIISNSYPFHPPTLHINNKPYLVALGVGNFSEYVSKELYKMNIKCLTVIMIF